MSRLQACDLRQEFVDTTGHITEAVVETKGASLTAAMGVQVMEAVLPSANNPMIE